MGARNLAPKPRTIDHVHAAAVPQAGLTAWQALFGHGGLARGQTVVIHGAGGAVGSVAVQLARWADAEVIGTGHSHSRSLVLELGADHFVAPGEEGLKDAAGSAGLVFDTIGGEVLARSASVVKPGGTLVSVAAFPSSGREDIREIFFIQESNRKVATITWTRRCARGPGGIGRAAGGHDSPVHPGQGQGQRRDGALPYSRTRRS